MKFVTRKKIAIISAIAVFITAVISVGAFSVSAFNGKNRQIPIYSVNTDKKVVAISFDCAWGVDYTDKLLDIMKEENVLCTFFAVEFWVKKHPEYVKKIKENGHEIGTHSSTHPYMSRLTKETVKKELISSVSAIEEITGEKVVSFRPPYGDYNDTLILTAKELGLNTIQWSVDSLDWKDLSKTEIENRVIKGVKNGSIVLFHNQGLHTHEALRNVIRTLKKSGYEFKRIKDMIYKDNYYISPSGEQTLKTVG